MKSLNMGGKSAHLDNKLLRNCSVNPYVKNGPSSGLESACEQPRHLRLSNHLAKGHQQNAAYGEIKRNFVENFDEKKKKL